jgi:hypothetical protein
VNQFGREPDPCAIELCACLGQQLQGAGMPNLDAADAENLKGRLCDDADLGVMPHSQQRLRGFVLSSCLAYISCVHCGCLMTGGEGGHRHAIASATSVSSSLEVSSSKRKVRSAASSSSRRVNMRDVSELSPVAYQRSYVPWSMRVGCQYCR